jgi:hypothetical protein
MPVCVQPGMNATPLWELLLAGATGALTLRFLIRFIQFLWGGNRRIATYDCALDGNSEGNVCHSKGKAVDDPKASNNRAWQHSEIGDGGACTLYGPYTNDFGKPGFYKVTFFMYASGYENTVTPSIHLKVGESRSTIILTPAGPAPGNQMIAYGHRVIRAKDLANSTGYQSFEVICYCAGSGIYEYTAQVVNWKNETLQFDRIEVRTYMPFREVFT